MSADVAVRGHLVDDVDDAFFDTNGRQLYLLLCSARPDATFHMVVRNDKRTSRGGDLPDDLSRHLIAYDCADDQWTDFGLFQTQDGKEGKAGRGFQFRSMWNSQSVYTTDDVVLCPETHSLYISLVSHNLGESPVDSLIKSMQASQQTVNWQLFLPGPALMSAAGETTTTASIPSATTSSSSSSNGSGLRYSGTYDAKRMYRAGDVVFHRDTGCSYVSLVDANIGADPEETLDEHWGMLAQEGLPGKNGRHAVYRGTYKALETYQRGDIVHFQSSSYACVQDGGVQNTPPVDSKSGALSSAWGPVALKGEDGIGWLTKGPYDADASYDVNDVVTLNGSSYVCIKTTPTTTPGVPTPGTIEGAGSWLLIAERGQDAEPGMTFAGTWLPSSVYAKNRVVFHVGSGTSYVSLVDDNQNHEPDATVDTFWSMLCMPGAGFQFKQTYQGGSSYQVNDVVYSDEDGSAYVCIQAHGPSTVSPGITDDDNQASEYWSKLLHGVRPSAAKKPNTTRTKPVKPTSKPTSKKDEKRNDEGSVAPVPSAAVSAAPVPSATVSVAEGGLSNWQYRGLYDPTTLYGLFQVVFHLETGSSYISLESDNQGHAPDATVGAFWGLLAVCGRGEKGETGPAGKSWTFRGTWLPTTKYDKMDVVFHALTGSSYISLIDGNVNAAPNPSVTDGKWSPLALRGDDGQDGDHGRPGIDAKSGSSSSSFSFSYRGNYSSTALYKANDLVINLEDGCSYLSLQDNNAGNPVQNAKAWGLVARAGLQGKPGDKGEKGGDGRPGSGFTYRNNWVSKTTYVPGDVVFYVPTGTSYVSLVDSNLNAAPSASPTKWAPIAAPGAGLSYRGVYQDGASYGVNDMVHHDGSSYLSLQADNRGHTPVLSGGSSFWGLLALEGVPGNNGNDGKKGDKGDKGSDGKDGKGLVFRNNWVPKTTYDINDVVYHAPSGSAYISIVTGNANHDPSSTPTKWSPLASRGADGTNGTNGTDGKSWTHQGSYDAKRSYGKGDVVMHDDSGSSYVSLTDGNKDNDPSDDANTGKSWAPVALEGLPGKSGAGFVLNVIAVADDAFWKPTSSSDAKKKKASAPAPTLLPWEEYVRTYPTSGWFGVIQKDAGSKLKPSSLINKTTTTTTTTAANDLTGHLVQYTATDGWIDVGPFLATTTTTLPATGAVSLDALIGSEYAEASDVTATTAITAITSKNWQDVKFGQNVQLDGWKHAEKGASFVSPSANVYAVEYTAYVQNSSSDSKSSPHVTFQLLRQGQPLPMSSGTAKLWNVVKSDGPRAVHGRALVACLPGEELKLQVQSTGLGPQLVTDGPPAVSLWIRRA